MESAVRAGSSPRPGTVPLRLSQKDNFRDQGVRFEYFAQYCPGVVRGDGRSNPIYHSRLPAKTDLQTQSGRMPLRK